MNLFTGTEQVPLLQNLCFCCPVCLVLLVDENHKILLLNKSRSLYVLNIVLQISEAIIHCYQEHSRTSWEHSMSIFKSKSPSADQFRERERETDVNLETDERKAKFHSSSLGTWDHQVPWCSWKTSSKEERDLRKPHWQTGCDPRQLDFFRECKTIDWVVALPWPKNRYHFSEIHVFHLPSTGKKLFVSLFRRVCS